MKTVLQLRITPNARKTEVIGRYGEAIKIKVQAPPVDGKANKTLLTFLSEQLQLPERFLHVCGGEKSRDKRIEVEGLEAAHILRRLGL